MFVIFQNLFNKNESEPAPKGNIQIGSFFLADDIEFFSESKKGLECSLNQLNKYCFQNEMKVNVCITKCMISNKSDRIRNTKIFYY